MTLREMVIDYRKEHDLSQRQFAISCGLSNGYISMLEKNRNPKTGLPVTPSLPALKKIAAAMSMSLADLLAQVDDMLIDISAVDEPEKEISALITEGGSDSELNAELVRLVLSLPSERKQEALHYLQFLSGQ